MSITVRPNFVGVTPKIVLTKLKSNVSCFSSSSNGLLMTRFFWLESFQFFPICFESFLCFVSPQSNKQRFRLKVERLIILTKSRFLPINWRWFFHFRPSATTMTHFERGTMAEKSYLPLLVMTISVPSLWNFSQRSLPSRVTLGSSTTPSSSGWIARNGLTIAEW